MKKIAVFLVLCCLLGSAGLAQAQSVTLSVGGRSGPWDPALNPGYGYGDNGNPSGSYAPAVVDASLLPFLTGDELTIAYLDGLICAGASGTVWADAGGVLTWPADSSWTPAGYIPGTQYLVELLGVFADNGVIVGQPFAIGKGPLSVIIPVGANQLLLGFNDGWYYDNYSSLRVTVAETTPSAATPEPSGVLLALSGLLGLAALRKRMRR